MAGGVRGNGSLATAGWHRTVQKQAHDADVVVEPSTCRRLGTAAATARCSWGAAVAGHLETLGGGDGRDTEELGDAAGPAAAAAR